MDARGLSKRFVIGLGVLALAVTVGCSNAPTTGGTTGGGNQGGGMMGGSGTSSTPGAGGSGNQGGGMMGGSGSSSGSYSTPGERIYLTGVGVDGKEIARTAPAVSQGSLMMGGGGCGSCHAANGRGGTIKMMNGQSIDAPDITYGSLIKTGFTDSTIRRAIRDGLDEGGAPLEAAMPRWQMTTADLDAIVAYLKVLGP